jgi:hypothetical protein
VELIVLAARHQTPAIYEFHEFVDAGGVMSYGTSLTEGTLHLSLARQPGIAQGFNGYF